MLLYPVHVGQSGSLMYTTVFTTEPGGGSRDQTAPGPGLLHRGPLLQTTRWQEVGLPFVHLIANIYPTGGVWEGRRTGGVDLGSGPSSGGRSRVGLND